MLVVIINAASHVPLLQKKGMWPREGDANGWGWIYKALISVHAYVSVWPWLEGIQGIIAHLLTTQSTSRTHTYTHGTVEPHQRDRLLGVKLIIVFCRTAALTTWGQPQVTHTYTHTNAHTHTKAGRKSDKQTAGRWQHATMKLFG